MLQNLILSKKVLIFAARRRKPKRTEIMKHFKTLIICGAIGLMLASCATKQRAIDQLENFSYELRDNSRYYDIADWEKAGKKFVKIRKDINKHEFDYTAEEKQRIGKLEGDCARYMAKGAKEGVFDKLMNIGGEIKGILDGILGF